MKEKRKTLYSAVHLAMKLVKEDNDELGHYYTEVKKVFKKKLKKVKDVGDRMRIKRPVSSS